MNTRSYSQPEQVPTVKWTEHPYKPGHFVAVRSHPKRLPDIDYTLPSCICFVTFNLRGEESLFNGEVAATAWRAFLDYWALKRFTVHTVCLMPDHMHLLIAPTGQGESITDIVGGIKLTQSHAVNKAHGKWLRWQPSFHDHVLGRSSDIDDEFQAIRYYIQQNPVRANLVASATEYPFVL